MTPRKPSLNTRLARHVMVPLVVTWAIGAVVTASVANVFTQQAFDRSLLDDAYLLSSRVMLRDGALALALSSNDMTTLLFDPSETEFFAVLAPGGRLVAGHAGLRPRTESGPAVEFSDLYYQNRRLRGVRSEEHTSELQSL